MKTITFLRIDPGFSIYVAKATTIHRMEPPKGGRRPSAEGRRPPFGGGGIVIAFAPVTESP